MKKEKYKIMEGGKITFEMPEVTITYFENKFERHAEILAELLSREVAKPKFSKKMEEIVENMANEIMATLTPISTRSSENNK